MSLHASSYTATRAEKHCVNEVHAANDHADKMPLLYAVFYVVALIALLLCCVRKCDAYKYKKETCKYVCDTYLHSHGDILLADIMVVLVSVQHNDSVGQCKASIVGHERRAVDFLQTQALNCN